MGRQGATGKQASEVALPKPCAYAWGEGGSWIQPAGTLRALTVYGLFQGL